MKQTCEFTVSHPKNPQVCQYHKKNHFSVIIKHARTDRLECWQKMSRMLSFSNYYQRLWVPCIVLNFLVSKRRFFWDLWNKEKRKQIIKSENFLTLFLFIFNLSKIEIEARFDQWQEHRYQNCISYKAYKMYRLLLQNNNLTKVINKKLPDLTRKNKTATETHFLIF